MINVRADHLAAALLFAFDVADTSGIEISTGAGSVAVAGAERSQMALVELAASGAAPGATVRISRADALDLAELLQNTPLDASLVAATGLGVSVSGLAGEGFAADIGGSSGLAEWARFGPTASGDTLLTAPLDLHQLGRVAPHFDALCPCNLSSNPGQIEIRPGRRAVVIHGGRDHEILNVKYILNTELTI